MSYNLIYPISPRPKEKSIMVVKPISHSELKQKEDAILKNRLNDLISKINGYLNEGVRNLPVKTLGLDSFKDSALIDRIMADYRAEGWHVKRNKGSDQRDGDEWDDLVFD